MKKEEVQTLQTPIRARKKRALHSKSGFTYYNNSPVYNSVWLILSPIHSRAKTIIWLLSVAFGLFLFTRIFVAIILSLIGFIFSLSLRPITCVLPRPVKKLFSVWDQICKIKMNEFVTCCPQHLETWNSISTSGGCYSFFYLTLPRTHRLCFWWKCEVYIHKQDHDH